MSRWVANIMVLLLWVATPPSARSLLWRIPVAVGLGIVAMCCFIADDIYRAVRRRVRRFRNG